jgi:hypothetical protein
MFGKQKGHKEFEVREDHVDEEDKEYTRLSPQVTW